MCLRKKHIKKKEKRKKHIYRYVLMIINEGKESMYLKESKREHMGVLGGGRGKGGCSNYIITLKSNK